MAVRNLNVMGRLDVLEIPPSIQKYAVGPLIRLGISPILHILVGRPKVLAAKCARMHSSGDALRSANLYIKEASRFATSADVEKVCRMVSETEEGANYQ
jgi:hypothetical protein